MSPEANQPGQEPSVDEETRGRSDVPPEDRRFLAGMTERMSGHQPNVDAGQVLPDEQLLLPGFEHGLPIAEGVDEETTTEKNFPSNPDRSILEGQQVLNDAESQYYGEIAEPPLREIRKKLKDNPNPNE